MNFAFLGQFAETERDTIFTTEYSMRTGMEAVHTLLDIDRGVPEVWGSTYDVRDLINASVQLRGRPQAHRAGAESSRALAPQARYSKSSMAPTWRSCSRTTTPSDRGPGALKSAGAGARQKGLLNASGRFKRLFIGGTASTGGCSDRVMPTFSGGARRGRCR